MSQDAKQPVSFGSTRAHFGYQYYFSRQLSAKVILDAAGRTTTVGNLAVKDSAGRMLDVTNSSIEGSFYTAFLKFAFIQWRPFDRITLQLGGIPQNHYFTQENFWGYRYVYETFQDRYYGTASGDWGAIVHGKVNKSIGLDFAVTNGEGIRFKQDSYGKVRYAGGIDLSPIHGLVTRLYYDNLASGDSIRFATQHLFSFFTGYALENAFRVGVDANYRKNNQNITSRDLFGYSLFGTWIVSPEVECFVRFDKLMANTVGNTVESWNLSQNGQAYIVGLQYQPATTMRFAINYQGWRPEDASVAMTHYIMLNTEFRI